MQKTISSPITIHGIGLHGGAEATIVLRPAGPGFGVHFRRCDLAGIMIEAVWSNVNHSALCTKLQNCDGVSVATVEHLMAALHALGITNLLIDLYGPEVPILDGSALPFIEEIDRVGVVSQSVPAPVISILQAVTYTEGSAFARLEPANEMSLRFSIDFPEPSIGRQEYKLLLSERNFRDELAMCRTFCRQSEVDYMRSVGLARGGSLANAVVFSPHRVINPEGLRHPQEPVRHKMLDAVGDLYLAGARLLGAYTGHKAGHSMTNKLLRKVFADKANFEVLSSESLAA